MFKHIVFRAVKNERTGYGVHASRFEEALNRLLEKEKMGAGAGECVITLLDTVSASHVKELPKRGGNDYSILYNVWESTEQPAEFISNLKNYDQLWVPSEWQRAASIAQGVPEEFVKVVPEGVDPDVYKPGTRDNDRFFNFVHVGQWQPRKSTLEICQQFLKAFPGNEKVRLYLSADTLFPSDEYKSTEERLKAYGVDDPRIIPVHFEERGDYIRRLQAADCFVSCSRSEGWGLPIIEAMACGIPTIVADFGGSTEYAFDAIRVRVPELKKPFGIYGNWDVPGMWGEPDYNHLRECMIEVYENWDLHKERALMISDRIRKDFSWDAAAAKALNIIKEIKIHAQTDQPSKAEDFDAESHVRELARKYGFEITAMKKIDAVFYLDCWPDTDEKMNTLRETIGQVRGFGYPILISTHYPLPKDVIESVDYYLFEKQDNMSGEDKPVYWRTRQDGTVERKQASKEYQGCAVLNCFRNTVDFCRGRFEWIYQMGADMEVDLKKWLQMVHAAKKPMVCIPYEGKRDGIGGGLWAGKTEVFDKLIPRLNAWEDYAKLYSDLRFVTEKWIYKHVEKCGLENEIEWIELETSNRFDNVDREIWKDDDFQCHFVEGPILNIVGISNREYDVEFKVDGELLYSVKMKCGMWARPNTKYFKNWEISAYLDGELKFRRQLDLKGQRVLISMGSKALGDTIAWMPYVEEFRKKHGCHVICSGWWTDIFDYPEIEFISPGVRVDNVYASYDVGCFDGQMDRNVTDWRLTILQKVSADILGIEYKPIRAKLKRQVAAQRKSSNGDPPKPYVCFSEYSTMKNKLWNREGAWQKVIDHLVEKGYECISISTERTQLQNVTSHNGAPIERTIADVAGADFYIGLNAGPSWIAYALDVPCVMITGVSEEWNDFPNPYRVSTKECTPGCFNDPSHPINRGWEWCPRNRDYACTKSITEAMVIDTIERVRGDSKCLSKYEKPAEENTALALPMESKPKRQHLRTQSLRSASLTQ